MIFLKLIKIKREGTQQKVVLLVPFHLPLSAFLDKASHAVKDVPRNKYLLSPSARPSDAFMLICSSNSFLVLLRYRGTSTRPVPEILSKPSSLPRPTQRNTIHGREEALCSS